MAEMKATSVPKGRGKVGAVIDSNVEGMATEKVTIRKNSRAQGSKSAGNVGATNVSHS